MVIVDDFYQRSPEWFEAKRGIPSASNFDKIITTKGAPSKQVQGYMYELAAQVASGQYVESYINSAMAEGIRREEESRELFSMLHDVEVREVALIYPDEQKQYVCSPDGLFNNNTKGLELKNPLPKTQVKYLMDGEVPNEYILQIQGSMFVTGFDSWWFQSYAPGLPVLSIEVYRNEKLISRLKEELERFVYKLAAIVKRLKEMQ